MTSTNSSTQGPFYLVVLQLIIASKLSELEQFENQATNYRIASRKGWKWEKIKLRLLQSFRKGVFWQGDVVLAVNFNFNGGFLSWTPFLKLGNSISLIFSHFHPFLIAILYFASRFSNCSNSLNFEAIINCNTTK